LLAPATTDEARRKRRASANRILNTLRALLNQARKAGHVASDKAWKDVKPLKRAKATALRWMTPEEMRLFIAACEGGFKTLATAALLSGCRFGELCKLVVEDFERETQTLLVRESKSDTPRNVALTLEGVQFFENLTAGRSRDEPMLSRDDGEPWRSGMQDRPMRAACARAGIKAASFHSLRRSYASAAVRAGVHMQMVAANLGHSTIRMLEEHYAHHSPEERLTAVQGKMATPFGLLDDDNGGAR
jgi:integrase